MGGIPRIARRAAALVSLLLAAGATAQPPVGKLGPGIVSQLNGTGEAEVFVMLREPPRAEGGGVQARRRAIRTLRAAVLSSCPPHAMHVRQQFSTVSGFTASVTAGGLATLLAHPAVLRVDPMMYGSGALAQSVPQIRADAVHRRDDVGQNVTVAVLDTGVEATHPDLAGSIVAEQCFCNGNCCPNGASRQSGPGSAFTNFVHGIHVTGIIVSKGIVAPVGVAPGAKVVAVKVLNDQNRGSLADWIAALDWIATERADVQAINMSLVSDSVYPGQCDDASAVNMAFAQVLNVLRARGTLTFVAAGNGGQTDAMGAPACIGAAVSVGAVTKGDEIWMSTDRDATLDVLAPGVAIVSTGPQGSTATLTGTSMAAPHVTGTAALMLAMNPGLGADQLESALKGTRRLVVDARNGLSFPRVNALSALNVVLDDTRPFAGGGGDRTDCLVEWSFPPATTTLRRPRTGGAMCRDNDPACDADRVPGRCTFQVSLCFNVSDRRLPRCGSDAPIVGYDLVSPSAAQPSDVDAANAGAISGALPPLPINDANHCTVPIAFVVPAEAKPGTKWLRFSARASDGRVDHDALRLVCLPSQS